MASISDQIAQNILAAQANGDIKSNPSSQSTPTPTPSTSTPPPSSTGPTTSTPPTSTGSISTDSTGAPISRSFLNPEGVAQSNDLGGNLLTGVGSALNEVGFGAPEALLKLISPEGYKAVEAYKNAHSAANIIGGTAGDIGSMFIPGLDLINGGRVAAEALHLGKTAEVLAKAAEVAKKSGIVGGLLSGAAQAVPRAISSGITTGDWGNAAVQAGAGTALGGALGGVSHAFSPNFQADIGVAPNQISKGMLDAQLSSKGISGNDLVRSTRAWANENGLSPDSYMLKNAQNIKQKVWDQIKDLHGEDAIRDKILGMGPQYEDIDNAYMAKLKELGDTQEGPFGIGSSLMLPIKDPATGELIQTSLNGLNDDNPQFKNLLLNTNKNPEDIEKIANGMLIKLDEGTNSVGEAKDFLRTQMKNGRVLGGEDGLAQTDVASMLYDTLNQHVINSNPNYKMLNEQFSALAPIRKAVALDEMRITPPSRLGSDTAAKLGTTMSLGGLMGAASGSQEIADDPWNPKSWADEGLRTLAGSAIGGVANKLGSGMLNLTAGKLAGIGKTVLPPVQSGISKLIGSPYSQQLLTKAGGLLPGKTFAAPSNSSLPSEGIDSSLPSEGSTPPPSGSGGAGGSAPPSGNAGAGSAGGAPTSITAPVLLKAQQVNSTLQGQPPQVQQQEQSQFLDAHSDRIAQSLHSTYVKNFSFYNPNNVTEQQFTQQVAQMTNNFDISNPYTAAVLFPDNPTAQSKFLDGAKSFLQLKSIGLPTALDQNPRMLGVKSFTSSIVGGNDNKKIMAYNNLKDSLTKLAGGDKTASKDVQDRLYRIMLLNIPVAQKQQMVMQLSKQLGMPLDMLESVGVHTGE